MAHPLWYRTLVVLFAVIAAAVPSHAAERPNAMRLFPSRAVFFVRTPDATEMSQRFQATAGGRMNGDPEVAPFFASIYEKVNTAFREGPGKDLGGDLSDLLNLFQGEVAFAVVPRRGAGPGLLFLADTVSGEDRAAGDPEALAAGRDRAAQMIESLRETAPGRDRTARVERIGAAEATVFRQGDDAALSTGWVERDGVLVVTNDRALLESTIAKWDDALGLEPLEDVESGLPADEQDARSEAEVQADEDEAHRLARLLQRYAEPLADKEGFSESLRQCVEDRLGGGDESPPQMVGYIDPLGIFRAVAQRNAGARIAYATLPALGLDGVQGAAAAMWMDEGQWDSLLRAHLLLDNPRSGVLKLLRLAPADPSPGDAVPADVVRYGCAAIDLAAILAGAEELHDKVRGEGTFAELVDEQFTKRIGHTPTEVIDLLTGRFVSLQAYGDTPTNETAPGVVPTIEPPRAVLLDVTDPGAAEEMIRDVFERLNAKVEWDTYAGVTYATRPWPADNELSEAARTQATRPCVMILEDQVVVTQSLAILQKLVDTHLGEHPRLEDHLPFRLTSSRANRLGSETVGGDEGRLLIYEDATPFYERAHAALVTDAGREQIETLAERAPPLRWLRDTLNETDAPPVEALLRYAAPSGSAVYDTPRGFRFVAFSFRPVE